MNALILSWRHPTNTVMSLAHSLARGLADRCQSVTICDLHDPQQVQEILHSPRDRFQKVFTMGPLGLNLRPSGNPIYQYFEADVFFWVLDAIIYDLNRFPFVLQYVEQMGRSPRLHMLFPDKSCMKLPQAWGLGNCHHFPFGTEVSHAADASFETGLSKKSDVLVFAHVGQELHAQAGHGLHTIIEQFDPFHLTRTQIHDLAEYIMHDETTCNITLAVQRHLGLDWLDLYRQETLNWLCAIDASEKLHRRLNVLNSVRDIPVDVIGSGWSQRMETRKNLHHIADSIPHHAMHQVFKRYRVLLDFSPNWDEGFNDRVVPCLYQGCRVVTSRNSAMHELEGVSEYTDGYSMQNPDAEDALARSLNRKAPDAASISALGQAHSWRMRVDKYLSPLV